MMPPKMEGFKPFGTALKKHKTVGLLYEEYEAIRLVDYENLTHREAAGKMNISRPTFTRLYDKARKNIAKALVDGKTLLIKGGTFITDNYWYRCYSCHETMISIKPTNQCRKCDSENIIELSNTTNAEK